MWKTGNFGVFFATRTSTAGVFGGGSATLKSDVRKKLRSIAVYETDCGDTALESNCSEGLFSS